MISVAHLTDVVDNRFNSGTARVCREIIVELSKNSEVKQYLIHFGPSDDPIYKLKNVEEIKIPLKSLPVASKFISFIFFFILNRKIQFDVCHWHTFRVYPFFWVIPAKKYLVTIHDDGVFTLFNFRFFYNKIFAWTLIIFQTKIELFIVDSYFSRKRMASTHISPDRIKHIHLGSRFMNVKAIPVRNFNYSEKYILCVSRWQPLKNVESLVESFILAKNKYAENFPYRLVLVGKPVANYNRPIELIRDYKNFSDFVILENLTDENLASLYDNATFAVLPSLFEGFGLPALESLSRGCSILVHQNSASAEVVKKKEFEIDMENIFLLSEKLFDFSNSQLNQDMYSQNQSRAREFTWTNYVKSLMIEYLK
jgi:glycosyltransferase involved in cell wall biosynthesis